MEQQDGVCMLVVKSSPVPEPEASGEGGGGAVKKLKAQKVRDAPFLYIRMGRKYVIVIINSWFYEQLGFHCLFEGFEKLT